MVVEWISRIVECPRRATEVLLEKVLVCKAQGTLWGNIIWGPCLHKCRRFTTSLWFVSFCLVSVILPKIALLDYLIGNNRGLCNPHIPPQFSEGPHFEK